MNRLFSIARVAAFATLALGAGALIAPAPAEAQGRGYSAGGGARFAGARAAGPRMGMTSRMRAPRTAYRGARGFAPRVAGYRYPGYRPGYRPVARYYRNSNRYWPVAAGVGILGAAAIANSGYYYANSGYYGQQCWLERRTVRSAYGHRVINVRVCPAY